MNWQSAVGFKSTKENKDKLYLAAIYDRKFKITYYEVMPAKIIDDEWNVTHVLEIVEPCEVG